MGRTLQILHSDYTCSDWEDITRTILGRTLMEGGVVFEREGDGWAGGKPDKIILKYST